MHYSRMSLFDYRTKLSYIILRNLSFSEKVSIIKLESRCQRKVHELFLLFGALFHEQRSNGFYKISHKTVAKLRLL